ncbi:MAG: DNA internalization-related competence protein ComEC/Rec2 [Bacillaceae bacterium]|nr:DNA internalization-related competence protein ComEC/Rec2 [Bacillaceae bacterium]
MKGKWHYIAFLAFMVTLWGKEKWPGYLAFCVLLLLYWPLGRISRLFFSISLGAIIVYTALALNSPTISYPEKELPQKTVTIHGTIMTSPEILPPRISFVLKDHSSNVQTKVYVNPPLDSSFQNIYQRGAICEISGHLTVPEKARNPGNFDYREYLNQQGITYVLFSEGIGNSCDGQSLLAFGDQLRYQILQFLKRQYSRETFSWIKALVFGSDDLLPEETIEAFRTWNLAHLLAISGLHTGLVILFFYGIGKYALRLTETHVKIFLMVTLAVFLWMAGANPPVFRAVMMAECILLLSFFKKHPPISDVLSLIAILFMLFRPSIVFNIGFQFSFLVTYVLVFSKDILLKNPSLIWKSVYISFISQMVLIPLQLYYFYYINPLSLFINLFIVPYFSFVVIPVLLIFVICAWLPAQVIHMLDNLFIQVHEKVIQLIHLAESWYDGVWVIGKITWLSVMLYLFLFYWFMNSWEYRKFRRSFYTGCLLVLLLFSESISPYFSEEGSITMLDVGQGDALVIELPYRKEVIMIDAAGTGHSTDNKTFQYQIKPFLWSKGIKQIDHLILTHFDQDHSGSAEEILTHFQVRHIYTHPFYQEQEFQEHISYTEAIHHTLYRGLMLQFPPYELYVLNPDPYREYDSENNRSVVLYGVFGGTSFLFTGDIDAITEENISIHYPELDVNVLKVSHHGSKYSTSEVFLNHLSPDIAWISAGADNRYGHPSWEVIKRLEGKKIRIFRTDQHGAIIFQFNHQSGTFLRMNP